MNIFTIFLILLLGQVHSQVIKFNQQNKSDKNGPKIKDNSVDDQSIKDRGLFKEFKQKYNKKYSNEAQQQLRLNYFKKSLREVESHRSNSSYKKKINKFADLQINQWKKIFLSSPNSLIDPDETPTTQIIEVHSHKDIKRRVLQHPIADSLDWRLNITFSPVKFQGECASCYAYASVGAIQVGATIFYNLQDEMLVFSEQQAIDCCSQIDSRCGGCNNGFLSLAYRYYAQKGLSSDIDYPIVFDDKPQQCNKFAPKTSYLNITKPYLFVKSPSSAINYLNLRPLSALVDSSQWRFYSEGIFDDCKTVNFTLNHGVVLIGYQQRGDWILRNSWGDWWGENGYIRITPKNSCGITQYMYLPMFPKQ